MDKLLNELESVLTEQTLTHERLLGLMQRKRRSLGTADRAALGSLCEQENGCIQRISELEKRRLNLVAELSLLIEPDTQRPLPLRELAERLPEPARGRLLVLRAKLRERITQVSKQSAVARQALETLVGHMTGLIQTVGGVMSGVGTYNRAGALPQTALAVHTFNATA